MVVKPVIHKIVKSLFDDYTWLYRSMEDGSISIIRSTYIYTHILYYIV